MLSGFVVLSLTVFAVYVMNRLWQRSLMAEAGPAMEAAVALGFTLDPVGFGPRVRATGTWAGEPVVVTWSGGVFGSRTLLCQDGKTSIHRLIGSAAEMQRLLGGEE